MHTVYQLLLILRSCLLRSRRLAETRRHRPLAIRGAGEFHLIGVCGTLGRPRIRHCSQWDLEPRPRYRPDRFLSPVVRAENRRHASHSSGETPTRHAHGLD
ncbi:MAG: hypothetical protein EA425_07180 [Puniceicoccaceae bacterium]|nr:MAG: hypothetical protein EA425_07180 [Puniceicoccaceae bacterium]